MHFARKWGWILAVVLTACRAKGGGAAQATDASSSPRVVSLSPSTTEALFVIGAGSDVVGRSRYCDWPPEVSKLPQVGGFVDPNFEAILALRPDLVTGARGPAGSALRDRLEERGAITYFPETESLAQINTMILGLGERTGHVAEARARVTSMDARIAAIEKAVAGEPRVRVLLVFGLEPLSVAGPGSFADEMIRHAGGDNVVTEGGAYPTLGIERVLIVDPDVVVNAAVGETHGAERIRKDTPGWNRVRAVINDHVVPLADETVLRPGPRVADGLATLAKAIHPRADIPADAATSPSTSP
ncbi:MAG: helical backbone metal receptor [Polyangiaceae bacterium]|nr:helical backbone metal receptor [Polyangiaceae bacterium]